MKYERSLQWRRIILLSFLAAVNRILCHCHKGNSAFVFSVFLIFMVAAAAFAPLLHHCHTTVNCTGSYRQVEDCMFLCGFLSLSFFFSLSLFTTVEQESRWGSQGLPGVPIICMLEQVSWCFEPSQPLGIISGPRWSENMDKIVYIQILWCFCHKNILSSVSCTCTPERENCCR